jgi:hypothetical protein
MMTHTVKIAASKAGSIGTKYCEKREYTVEGADFDEIISAAVTMAYNDGLEHVLVTHVDGEKTYN